MRKDNIKTFWSPFWLKEKQEMLKQYKSIVGEENMICFEVI
jgi:hypothetical protein